MSLQNRVRKQDGNIHIKKEIISKRESGKSVGDLNLHVQCTKINKLLLYYFNSYFLILCNILLD
jgi:hypothetical protein